MSACPHCVCVGCDAIEPRPCSACGAETTEFDRPADGGAWFCDDCLRANSYKPTGTYRGKEPTDWWSLVPASVRKAAA